MGIDTLGIDILGIDILGIDILALPHNMYNYKQIHNKNVEKIHTYNATKQ